MEGRSKLKNGKKKSMTRAHAIPFRVRKVKKNLSEGNFGAEQLAFYRAINVQWTISV